jgi:uncharacterized protein (TIGR02246 family)
MKTSSNNSVSLQQRFDTPLSKSEQRENEVGKHRNLHATAIKLRLLLTLAGLAIGLTGSALAAPGWLSGDLAGDVKALDEFSALRMKYDDAYSKRDAVALAALFTEDAVCVTPNGLLSGREAIQRWYLDHFQRSDTVHHIFEANQLNAIGNQVLSLGQWWKTVRGQEGPVFTRGYWSALFVREGDAWRIRMLTYNSSPSTTTPAGAVEQDKARKADHPLRGTKI